MSKIDLGFIFYSSFKGKTTTLVKPYWMSTLKEKFSLSVRANVSLTFGQRVDTILGASGYS